MLKEKAEAIRVAREDAIRDAASRRLENERIEQPTKRSYIRGAISK